MKFGVRKPSIKRSLKAKTTGRAKRAVKSSVNPLYGKKNMGLINDPKKSIYNKVYSKTTISVVPKFNDTSKKNVAENKNQNVLNINETDYRYFNFDDTSDSISINDKKVNKEIKLNKINRVLYFILSPLIILSNLFGLFSIPFGIFGIVMIVSSHKRIQHLNNLHKLFPEGATLQENNNATEAKVEKIKESIYETNLTDTVKDDLNISSKIASEMNNTDYGYEKELAEHKSKAKKINISELKQINERKELDLEPEEILFLSYVDGRKSSNYDYPIYWSRDYNLDFQGALTKLFKSGYLIFADSTYKLKSFKVTELKEILKDHNLKTTGKKADLIQRLADNLDDAEIDKLNNDDYFKVTEEGKKLLEQNKHIDYFKKRSIFDISIHTADKVIKKNPNTNHFSIALSVLEGRMDKYDEIEDHGLFRNNLYHISLVYKDWRDENKQLTYLLMVTCMDLFEGLYTYEKMKKLDMLQFYDKDTKKEMKESHMLAPGIISEILRLRDKFKIDNEQLKENLWTITRKLPINISNSLIESRFDLLFREIESLN